MLLPTPSDARGRMPLPGSPATGPAGADYEANASKQKPRWSGVRRRDEDFERVAVGRLALDGRVVDHHELPPPDLRAGRRDSVVEGVDDEIVLGVPHLRR